MRWRKKPVDAADMRSTAKTFEVDLITAAILERRNMTDAGRMRFLESDDPGLLHNPFLFAHMARAVDRIRAALRNGEKIFVFGDRDVDGITSTALMVGVLRKMGATCDWAVPMADEAYGLSQAAVEKALSSGARLMVAVDCGTSSCREVSLALESGIETIVVDHHNPADTLPDAVAILNPKLVDSGYAFDSLSACGVVFKLYCALAFSRCAYYNRDICLLNIKPLKDAYVLETVKTKNLIEQERLIENLVPYLTAFKGSRLESFFGDSEIVVFDGEMQVGQLGKIFKDAPELKMADIKAPIYASLPELRGKSLLKVREHRAGGLRTAKRPEEIDVLLDLFTHLVLEEEGLLGKALEAKIDLVALATLADIMPLVDENRLLVRLGLEVINREASPAMREIFARTGIYGRTIRSRDIIWQVAPLINASGRMGEPDKAVRLFLSESQQEIAELCDYIRGLNDQRKKQEKRAWDATLPLARQSHEKSGKKALLVHNCKISRGITGLLAARLAATFGVPSLVAATLPDKVVGSLRSPREYYMRDFLGQFADILTEFGGHDHAAGFTMPKQRLPLFEERFYQVVAGLESQGTGEESVQIDAELPPAYLIPDILTLVDFFEPYGEGNPPILFLTRGLTVLDCRLFGRKQPFHLKLLLDTGSYRWPAVLWGGAARAEECGISRKIDVVYRLSRTYFQGSETAQMIVEDFQA